MFYEYEEYIDILGETKWVVAIDPEGKILILKAPKVDPCYLQSYEPCAFGLSDYYELPMGIYEITLRIEKYYNEEGTSSVFVSEIVDYKRIHLL